MRLCIDMTVSCLYSHINYMRLCLHTYFPCALVLDDLPGEFVHHFSEGLFAFHSRWHVKTSAEDKEKKKRRNRMIDQWTPQILQKLAVKSTHAKPKNKAMHVTKRLLGSLRWALLLLLMMVMTMTMMMRMMMMMMRWCTRVSSAVTPCFYSMLGTLRKWRNNDKEKEKKCHCSQWSIK